MARISNSSPERVVAIKQFKGLNENHGGDTKLALGEASTCLNWRVTRDGNLQRRPGHQVVGTLSSGNTIKCMWNGWVAGVEVVLAACNSKLYLVYDGTDGTFPCSIINTGTNIYTSNDSVHIFGFDGKAYILDGTNYYYWDGTNFGIVTGYIPLVATAITPVGTAGSGGTLLEQVNKLSNQRKVWLSPDGTNDTFQMPEKPIASGVTVKYTSNGNTIPSTDYTVTTTTGRIKFNTAPSAATNSIEVTYSLSGTYTPRHDVVYKRYSELYSGTSDNRIFLYGDGSNELVYSDMDYNGTPRADYFPDLNVVAVGESNTPVTGLIRHHSRLICYKLDSTWSISASTLNLADGSLIPSFYVTPVNRVIGNEAMGQIQLVMNNPRSLFHDELYEWKSSNAYSGNLTWDERQAKRISDRIYTTLSTFDLSECVCYDDNANQEYYIVYNGNALVHNYAVDAWYKYSNIPATSFAMLGNELYFGTPTGQVRKFSETYKSDYDVTTSANIPISARWESGAMDLGADYMRKYSSALWVSVKPESNSLVDISIITDRRDDFAARTIARGASGFSILDFRSFSFSNTVQPQIKKLRIKAKKFVYYRLVFMNGFEDDQINTTATVLGADIRVRQTGYAK